MDFSIKAHRQYVILLILISGFVLFYQLGKAPLMDRDETRYSIMAKGMLDSGNWVVSYLNKQTHLDKPPMFLWLLVFSYKIFGVTEFASRFVPAIMALGTILLTYFIGSLFWNPRTGFLSGLILTTSIGFFIPARFVITDMTLTFFATLAMASLLGGLILKKRWFYMIMYLAFSGAMLTKGPVGIAIPALILLIYLWKTGQLLKIKEMYLHWGILIIAGLSLPWYFLANIRVPGYFYFFFVQENLMRFLTHVHQRSGPIYYYIPVVLIGSFPWIFFLPASLKKQTDELKSNLQSRFFCITWFLVGFIFFSLSGSKLPTYLLPYIIPIALLIGAYWDRQFTENKKSSVPTIWIYMIGLSLIGIALIIVGMKYPKFTLEPRAAEFLGWPMYPEAIIILLMGIIPLILYLYRKPVWSFSIIGLYTMALIFQLAILDEGPKFANYNSTRFLCWQLNQVIKPTDLVLVHHEHRWSVEFYIRDHHNVEYVDTLDELAVSLNEEPRTYVFLLHKSDFEDLKKLVTRPLYFINQEGDQILISN